MCARRGGGDCGRRGVRGGGARGGGSVMRVIFLLLLCRSGIETSGW